MLPSAATCRVEYVLPVGAHTEHHVQHKFTYGIGDSLNVLGLKGTLKIRPWSNLSDMGKDIFHRIRLLNTLSNLILNTTNDGYLQFLWATCTCASTPSQQRFSSYIHSNSVLFLLNTTAPCPRGLAKMSLYHSFKSPLSIERPQVLSLRLST